MSTTVSAFGGQVVNLALPLMAVLVLRATAWQMSVLIALETVPFVLCSLHAGVLIDRMRKLPIVIGSDVGRAAVLLAVPLARYAGVLSIELLYLVAFACGVQSVVGGAAGQVLVAETAGERRLVEANAKIAIGEHSASLVGPGVAGALVELCTAPLTIGLGALGFLASALILHGMQAPQDVPRDAATGSVWTEIREGIAFVRGEPVLRALTWVACLSQLLHQMLFAVLVLFAARDLALSAGAIGGAFVLAGAGCLAAALLAKRLSDRFGAGRTIILGLGTGALGWAAFGVIGGPPWRAAIVLGLALFVCDFGGTLYGIHYLALRQALTPPHLRGRMTATMRFFAVSAAPLGSVAGGLCATMIGLRATLLVAGALGLALAAATAIGSSLRTQSTTPRHGE